MNRTTHRLYLTLIATLALISTNCSPADSDTAETASEGIAPSQEWKDYWYAGEAELNRYALKQARYGEVHEGDAVLVFVTEDFNTDSQLKYEGGSREQLTSVLKLNFNKRFWTGIYPYSMMTSGFTPVNQEFPTLKVSTTAQEWCGHSYSQLNWRKSKYQGLLHSYFQNEGDDVFELAQATLEDEIWSLIRLNPDALPQGEISLIPGTQFLRLKHIDFAVFRASAILKDDPNTPGQAIYTINYNALDRTLAITFDKNFPHQILSWQEAESRGTQITEAVLTHSIKSPYWGQNQVADSVYRLQLGIEN